MSLGRNIADGPHSTKVALANLNSKQTFPQFKIQSTPQKVELHLKFSANCKQNERSDSNKRGRI